MLQAALQRMRVTRQGQVTMIVVDGQGAAAIPTMDYRTVEAWANKKASAPNANQSLLKVMEKVETMICRPGTTFASTRGSPKYVTDLAKAMISAGMDINEFSLPPDVKEAATSPAMADTKPARKDEPPEDGGTHGPSGGPANGPAAGGHA
jgi:hypothetical protein